MLVTATVPQDDTFANSARISPRLVIRKHDSISRVTPVAAVRVNQRYQARITI